LTDRTVLLDAPPHVAANLTGHAGVRASGDVPESAGSASVIRFIAPPKGPVERQLLAAQVRADAIQNTPARYNAVIVGEPEATLAVAAYLLRAGAVTGQVLAAAP
jgi:hypothetical protein